MLKVVGASWLQTRISTYILVAVVLLGLGAIIIGEFGRVENDGTYSATVTWNHRGGYKIDFLGQSNDLMNLPKSSAAKAYYKTRIHEVGWSFVEIETVSSYPDSVQAYAAGLLEGSLTWQLIHHHWSNTIDTVCNKQKDMCNKIRKTLENNTNIIRNKADEFADKDPFWHMVRLFYIQLDGMEAGWRFAVRKSRKNNVDIGHADFIWLAMAGDINNFGSIKKTTISSRGFTTGGIIIKYLLQDNQDIERLLTIIHHTAAPYTKMLRLLKKYKFGYHVSDVKDAERVPTNSIAMSSYPGALSSQDEYYIINGKKNQDVIIVTGTPLKTSNINREMETEIINIPKNYESHIVMSSVRIMSANWLANDAHNWSKYLAHRDIPDNISRPIQWAFIRAIDSSVWLVEQHSRLTHIGDYTQILNEKKKLFLDGLSKFEKTNNNNFDIPIQTKLKINELVKITENIDISKKHVKKLSQNSKKLMGENNNEGIETLKTKQLYKNLETKLTNDASEQDNIFKFRGDFDEVPVPFGIIDSKISVITNNGLKKFEAICGPSHFNNEESFDWSKSFPDLSHIGHPDKFDFSSVSPKWVWFD